MWHRLTNDALFLFSGRHTGVTARKEMAFAVHVLNEKDSDNHSTTRKYFPYDHWQNPDLLCLSFFKREFGSFRK